MRKRSGPKAEATRTPDADTKRRKKKRCMFHYAPRDPLKADIDHGKAFCIEVNGSA